MERAYRRKEMKPKLTRTQKMIADIIIIVIAVAAFVLIFVRMSRFNGTTIQQTVVVENGKVVSEPAVDSFTLKYGGSYSIAAKWWPEENPGFVSGLVVTDTDGEEIFSCTGNEVDAVSAKMKLAKGTYEIRFVYFASAEELNTFVEEHHLSILSDSTLDYEESGQWTMNYSVDFQIPFSTFLGVSVLMGIVIGLLLVRFFLVMTKTGDHAKAEYDERQELIRGKGYKYGFIALAFYNALAALLHFSEIDLPLDQGVQTVVGILLAAAVMITYNIRNDGYFALNEKRGTLIVIFIIVCLLNLVCGINNLHMGTVIIDGKLAIGSLNFFCMVFLIYTLGVLFIKTAADKREDEV